MKHLQVAVLTFASLGTFLAMAAAQAPPTPKAAPKAAPTIREMPADQKAYGDAMRLTDPEKKIEALQKFLTDFPTSAGTSTVQNALLRTMVTTYSKDKDKLIGELDKIVAGTAEAGKQLMLNNIAWQMFQDNVLLDEAERFANQSLALLDEKKFVEAQKTAAAARNQPAPKDEDLKKRFRSSQAMVQDTLGQIYVKQGKTAEGEKLLKQAFEANPTGALTAVTLADLAQKKGDDTAAFDYLATAVLAGRPPAGTKDKLEALYAKSHKDTSGLESMLDDRYRTLYPPLHVGQYKPTPERSDRTVLAEVFTGSACPPCVGADVGFDAMMERYSRKDLIVLMYHLHIPGLDPMTNPSTVARSKFYQVNSVPSYMMDGVKSGGGGSRDMAQGFYDRVNPTVEQRLEAAAEAKLALTATLEGTKAKVKADVSQIKGEPADVKLQIALVEEVLSYSGENGIRLHPVVVRSLGGEGNGGFTIDMAKPTPVEHTFDIAAITDELKTYLDDFESKAPGGRKFSQKKHEINPKNLSVVAFVQDQSSKKILQASYVRLKGDGIAAK